MKAITTEFGEPPETNRRPYGQWARIADELRSRPGEWAKCSSHVSTSAATTTAWSVRTGYFKALPAGEFEATARGLDVWVRYIGRAA